jgi:hypothetical protein
MQKELSFYLIYYMALHQRAFKGFAESLNAYVRFYLHDDFDFYFSTEPYYFDDKFINLLIKLCRKN